MSDIRINQLPLATGPTAPMAADVVALDGTTTRKAPLSSLGSVVRPFASQAESEAGTDNTKTMTPLTTSQAINALALPVSSIGSTVQAYSANLDELSPIDPGTTGKDILAATLPLSVITILGVQPNLKHFGWVSSGDNAAAIANMGSALGYVRFPAGETQITATMTMTYPMFFEDGAYITASAGITVNLLRTVNTPAQWIFRGDGSYLIPLPDAFGGEDIRFVRAIWFGAFTQIASDQAPAIQRACNALGNSREGVVMLDNGSYHIETGITLYRGTKLRSIGGVRNTVLQVYTDGYPVVQTANTACYIEDVQFENVPTSTSRSFPFVHIKHDFCEINRMFHQSAFNAIIVDGTECKVRNVEGVYGSAAPAAGSSQILIRATACEVDGMRSRFSSGAGPDSIVEIGTGASSSVTAFNIRNVEYIRGAVGVFINADTSSVARGTIDNVNYRGASGTAPYAIYFKSSGSASVFGIAVTNVTIGPNCTTGMKFEHGSSGNMNNVTVDGVYDQNTTGVGIELVQTAGSMGRFSFGGTINMDGRPTLITSSGAITNTRMGIMNRRLSKTSSWTVPASGIDNEVVYRTQSPSALVATLPATASEGDGFWVRAGSTGVLTLTAAAGATINNGASKALSLNTLYRVSCDRNNGGSAAEWSTQA